MAAKIVPGEGPPDARIVIVGEAPGAHEEKLGRPFVGPAGKLLSRLLARVGISRYSCYVTNVVKERPARNDISAFIRFRSKRVEVTPPYREYEEELLEEIKAIKPNVVVPMGRVPLYALTRKHEIMKWRGSILESETLPGTKVLPTIHPASALRQWIQTAIITTDLQKVKREAEYPDIRLPNRELLIRPTFDEAMSFLDSLMHYNEVAYDIEVVRGEVSCISFAPSPWLAMSIPFHDERGNYFSPAEEAAIWRAIARLLESEDVMKLGQNLIFDSSFLFRKYGIITRPIDDTMIAHGILLPELPKGLDFLTSVYTNEPYYKDEGKQWKRPYIDYEQWWLYNAKDSAVVMEVMPQLRQELQRQGNTETYHVHVSLIEPLTFMTEHGFRVDVDGIRKASEEAGKQAEELERQLHEVAGEPLNPNSPKQLKEYFYIKKGERPYVNKSTGNITVDETALKRLARKGYREADIILRLREIKKLKGTYLDVPLDSDGRLRSAYNPVGTKSGRLSSHRTIWGTGTNMQNQPPEMKRYLLADEGYVLYEVDLSQAENRCVAYFSPEPSMIKAFETGMDIHRLTASLIFNKPYDEVSNEPGSCPLAGGRYSERFWGKKANHALNYGLGYRTFALYYELPENEAKFIVERYHAAYPAIRQGYHEWVREQLAHNRTLTNPFGRRRVFLGRWGGELFKEAYSFLPQSTVADIINRRGLLPMYDDPLFRQVVLLNQVHDSIVFEIPVEDWDYHASVLRALKESLEQPIEWRGMSFVIPAEIKLGLNAKDTIEVDDLTKQGIKRAYEEAKRRVGR